MSAATRRKPAAPDPASVAAELIAAPATGPLPRLFLLPAPARV